MRKVIGLFVVVFIGMFLCGMGSAEPAYDGSEGVYNVYQCGDIDVPGVFTLNQSIGSDGTCLNISADDVMLNGNGKTVSFDEMNVSEAYGVFLGGNIDNITINNINIIDLYLRGAGFSGGVYVMGNLNHVFLLNSFIRADVGFYLTGGDITDVYAYNNVIESVYGGFGEEYASHSFEDLVFENNFINSSGAGLLFMGGCENCSFSGNNIFGVPSGSHPVCVWSGLSDITFSGNNVTSYSENGEIITFFTGRHNISNNFIQGGGIGIASGGADNSVIFNNIIHTGDSIILNYFSGIISQNSLFSTNRDVLEITIADMTFLDQDVGTYDFAGGRISIVDSFWGNISLYRRDSSSGYLSSEFSLGNNSAELSLQDGDLATVTLYGFSENMTNPVVLKDGTICEDCSLVYSNSANITFITSSSGSYFIDFSPVVYLFPVENSTLTSRIFTYNVSDDSNISNCSLYSNGVFKWNNESTLINQSTNNFLNWTNIPVGSYVAMVSCSDQFGNVGNSSNVSFNVIAEETETTQTSSGGGSRYSLSNEVLENGFSRNVGSRFVWKFNAGNENHTITFNDIYTDSLVFTIASTPRIFTVKLNDSVLIDVEEDGVYDLNITYNKYYGRLANVGIKAVSVKYGEDGIESGETEVEVVVESEGYTDWIIGIIVVALIIIGLVLVNSRHTRVSALRSRKK